MDPKSSNAAVTGALTTAKNAPKSQDNSDSRKKIKKKRGAMHLVRVALYMLKLGKSKQSNNAKFFKNFLGSMRPLHVQAHKSPPRLMEAPAVPLPGSPIAQEHLEVFTPPMSPAQASTSSGAMSQYASATNLEELDQNNESDESGNEDELYGNNGGDDMIDLKAEQFIAQFYHQMRAQNEAYTNRRNKSKIIT